jgi:hypothetical protein
MEGSFSQSSVMVIDASSSAQYPMHACVHLCIFWSHRLFISIIHLVLLSIPRLIQHCMPFYLHSLVLLKRFCCLWNRINVLTVSPPAYVNPVLSWTDGFLNYMHFYSSSLQSIKSAFSCIILEYIRKRLLSYYMSVGPWIEHLSSSFLIHRLLACSVEWFFLKDSCEVDPYGRRGLVNPCDGNGIIRPFPNHLRKTCFMWFRLAGSFDWQCYESTSVTFYVRNLISLLSSFFIDSSVMFILLYCLTN